MLLSHNLQHLNLYPFGGVGALEILKKLPEVFVNVYAMVGKLAYEAKTPLSLPK
ncbi:MAG: hypothetical protein ACI32Z_07415 [Clostridium sp.]